MNELLILGLESILKIKIIKDDLVGEKISMKDYTSVVHGINNVMVGSGEKVDLVESIGPQSGLIFFIRLLDGTVYPFQTNSNQSVLWLKESIFKKNSKVKVEDMNLIYSCKSMEDNKLLKDYDIRNESTVALFFKSREYQLVDVFDPQFDYSFKNVIDAPNSHVRGGYIYHRPCGSMRFALKVLGRFDNSNDSWIGKNGKGSWAVSYHNSISPSDMKALISTIQPGHSFNSHNEVLTTPNFEVAKKNAFKFFDKKGVTYYIIFQNRINPTSITKLLTKQGDEYWKTSNDQIRPYSICIGKV